MEVLEKDNKALSDRLERISGNSLSFAVGNHSQKRASEVVIEELQH